MYPGPRRVRGMPSTPSGEACLSRCDSARSPVRAQQTHSSREREWPLRDLRTRWAETYRSDHRPESALPEDRPTAERAGNHHANCVEVAASRDAHGPSMRRSRRAAGSNRLSQADVTRCRSTLKPSARPPSGWESARVDGIRSAKSEPKRSSSQHVQKLSDFDIVRQELCGHPQ